MAPLGLTRIKFKGNSCRLAVAALPIFQSCARLERLGEIIALTARTAECRKSGCQLDGFDPLGSGRHAQSIGQAVEKAGFTGLAEGAKVSYEVVANRGKESAENLRIG